MSEFEVIMERSYANANRIDGLFYSKSDEKFTMRALLDQLWGDAQFDRALDIGPGPGHITEPLAQRTRQLVLVEKTPEYEESLRRQFPTAKIIISDFEGAPLTGKFDVILLSHVLYYQNVDTWLPSCKTLMQRLSSNGELIVVLNSDSGDWWKIIHAYQPKLAKYMAFHYRPVSQFKRDLSQVGRVQSHVCRYQVWIEPGATWSDFIGKQMLELTDEAVLRQYEGEFAEFAKQFKKVDGTFVMDFKSEVLRIQPR